MILPALVVLNNSKSFKTCCANVNNKANNMPYVSKAQQGAMYAAAEGKSNIGIPKKVGKEFVKAGPKSKNLPVKAPVKKSGRGR
jgi:hypothetical protein